MSIGYMADSITTADLPSTTVVPGTNKTVTVGWEAGYVNGHWQNANDNVKRFGSSKRLVTIDTNGNAPSADVLDVENGDATPETSAWWIKHRIAGGFNEEYPGVIYCNRSKLTAVFNAQEAMGHKVGRDFRTWIATLDGTKEVHDMTGVTAVQVWPAHGEPGPATSGHFDLSIVYDTAWKAPTAPVTPPVKPPTIAHVVVQYSDGTTKTL